MRLQQLLPRGEHFLVGFLGIIIVAPIIMALLTARTIFLENYCSKKARFLVGDKGNVLYELTTEEKKSPVFKNVSSAQISWLFREQLRCEREFNLLQLLSSTSSSNPS